MSKSYTLPLSSARGSALFIVLVAVGLFAMLGFIMSRQRGSSDSLSSERLRLAASDIIDMGNKMGDTVAQMRLRKVPLNKLSFENDIVTGYENAACTVDSCKVFVYEGGGRDWETPASDVNGGADWGYTGSLSIEGVGTDDADLIAILPNISLQLCNRINRMLSLYDATGIPSDFNGVIADQYVGTMAVTPVNLTSPLIDTKSAACVKLNTPSGSALSGTYTNPYAYYQVLSAR